MNVSWSKMPTKVRALLIAALTYALGMNVDVVQRRVTPLLAHHPKLASVFGVLVFVVGLLQKPVVREAVEQVLHIDQTSATEAVVTVEAKGSE